MRPFRHFGFALWLALLLVVGQQAGLLHGLTHANEQLTHKPGTPAKVACDQCFACAQLSGSASCVQTPGVVHAHAIAPRSFSEILAENFTHLVFHSRAPPVLS